MATNNMKKLYRTPTTISEIDACKAHSPGRYLLNSHIDMQVEAMGGNNNIIRTIFAKFSERSLMLKAEAYEIKGDVDSRALYDVVRRVYGNDPRCGMAVPEKCRAERIGPDEYIITRCEKLQSSAGRVSRDIRVIAAYIKERNILVHSVSEHPGLGEMMLTHPEVTESLLREQHLALFREIYAYVFEGKGTAAQAGPDKEESFFQELNGLRNVDEQRRLRARFSEWKRALEDEAGAHPERFLGRMKDGNIPDEYAAYFHLPELSQEGVFPNINSGVAAGEQAVKALVKSVYGKKAKVTEVEGGIHASRAEVKVGEETLFIRVEHLPYRHMAMYRLLYCYPGYWRSPHAESKLAAVRQGRGLVGDFDLWRAPLLDENGIPVEHSGNNLVVFLRGNTLVELRMKELWQPDRDFDLRPLARAIDKLLVEGMRKAGEPLTREQDYLKEEKKQK